MPSTRPERILAGVGLVIALTLAGFTVPAVLDYRASAPDEASSSGAVPTSRPRPTPPPRTSSVRPATEEPMPTTTAAPTRAELELVAARGDCWLNIRLGSAEGRSVFQGILAQGSSRRFSARVLWLEIGAPSALDATLNGKKVTTLPDLPTTVVATPSGIRQASA